MTDNGFRQKNNCPYCGYSCNRAQMHEDENQKPSPGDLSFCLMCCEASQWDGNMRLKKFDINSITDIVERNRIKLIQVKMHRFWDENTHDQKTLRRREKYLSQCQ